MRNKDINDHVERLLDELHDGDDLKLTSYGETLEITEKQARILVVLNLIYEGRLIAALSLIEAQKTQVYVFRDHTFYTVDGRLITLASPCPCRQVECVHYLAALLLSRKYEFLDQYLLTKRLGRREFLSLVDETTALVQSAE